ncbi:glycoside hydrolase family 30 protein [Clostridium beijerinckii]|jgi:glucosylceramidase|uniref:Glycoside hydrolase family 30 protein n=2 Tax=Clostridium beijerinckii TaxID=1520 RepID=A0AAE2UXJ6_CLOBE|nr:glycoside hydrolase family 30 protein [Clostridium beijerinckii]AMQ96047.1 putative xylan-binding domain 30 protein [Clostridium sp. MF28]ABR36783.1 glycoside hydrolase, family 30 [Clostridium beijerinckii NCIMB 8052]AIU02390.1 glycoside hydrolase family protein [Clostridium beijerinckii ATCC 35702]MBF7808570.1 glycoside hydrolase family 30 protein [Clostridium beijerinckii]NRT22142.1 glucosylceramidase [Clostridium beijerinckii]
MRKATLISTTKTDSLVSSTIDISKDKSYHTLELNGESYQTIDGFGGCFNELGYIALKKIPNDKKEEVLRNLFDPEECNFTYCRLPIGANDYSESWYSLNETKGDYEMKNFSIERDKECLIPYIKEAEKYSGELNLFASPWSPPTWMKFPEVYNFGTLIWEEKNLKAYALYFKKFIEEYQKEGIKINQVHIQNEPIADQKFPSCVWSGKQLRDFIKEYIGPLFEENKLDAEIWLGTLNSPYDDYGDENWQFGQYNNFANTVLSDKDAKRYINGVGYQWGGKHALLQTRIAYPEMKLIQTENECGEGKNSWEYAEYVFNLMWTYFINGVNAYTYWNMVLEEEGISTWGWKQNSLITVTKDNDVKYNPEYYLMRHFSKYIKQGATMKGLKGDFAGNALAFENPDGSVVLELLNPFDELQEVTFSVNGEDYSFNIHPHSFNTLVV